MYDVELNEEVPKILPTMLRGDINVAWLRALMEPLNRLTRLQRLFLNGSEELPRYSDLDTYSKYDLVVFNRAVYECIVDSTIGQNPYTEAFKMVLKDFRGVRQLAKYDGSTIMMEFFINQWFDFPWNNRGGSYGGNKIYIENINELDSDFWIGETEEESSYIGIDAEQTNYIGDDNDNRGYDFIVWYPLAEFPSVFSTRFTELQYFTLNITCAPFRPTFKSY